MNSATVRVPDTDGKKFNIKEGSISMDCIFYEIVSFPGEGEGNWLQWGRGKQ